MRLVVPVLVSVLSLAASCASGAPVPPAAAPRARSAEPPDASSEVRVTRSNAGRPRDARAAERTWPSEARFAETAAALGRPWTLVFAEQDGARALAMARREGGAWQLAGWLHGGARPAGCDQGPCAWPASLRSASPLAEPPALPAHVVDAVAYARTLLAFEGPLSLESGERAERFGGGPAPELPEGAWSIGSPRSAPDLVPYLEQLRRYHPVGGCSMDETPQLVARMRATAAAQAGRTGWAVQGWVDTVAYFSSSRMAWSSYGQSHPEGHLELLEMVGVDAERLMLGLLIDLPGQERALGLADARRVAPDLGPSFAAELRTLASDPAIDPFNRALLFGVVADLPFENDPGYAGLPEESRALLAYWSR